MKKLILFLVLLFAIAETQAQSYQITFAGSGASTTVDSVSVENITQCTDTTLGGLDVLNLTATVSINEQVNAANNTLNIYPNPMTDACTLDFEATASGDAVLELYDITGKRIIQNREFLTKGYHAYLLNGIGRGIYLLKVSSENYSCAAKIVSTSDACGNAKIIDAGIIQNADLNSNVLAGNHKSVKSTIDMQYNAGDTLKLIGKSGIYRTVMMLIPTSTQTLTFNFVDCTDADGNHYAVVQIGTQLWMAEDLKTTKYRNGTSIPNLSDSALWHNATSAAYCDYHNLPAEGAQYGHLYNWWAADTSVNIAPVGWHVSADTEWTTLINFLGGDSIAGQKLKENCNTRWAYNSSTWGNNASGFTGLCVNFRNGKGATFDWSQAPNSNHDTFFWTNTEYNISSAYVNSLRWCYNDVWRCGFVPKSMGAAIRCVHD